MNGYTEIATRSGVDGVLDKLSLIERMADQYSFNRAFSEKVLRTVARAGSGADKQASAWCKFVERLPYRREPGEVLRSPCETVGATADGSEVGGDCDDLVVALLAGLRALAIPARAEILATERGHAFHVRVRVGLPPLRPTTWAIVDPVWQSERQWAMIDQRPLDNSLLTGRAFTLAGQPSAKSVSTWNWSNLIAVGIVAAWAWFAAKWSKDK